MQYTGSSFVQPLTDLFRVLLRTRKSPPVLAGYTPNADVRYEWRLTGVPRRGVRYSAG